MHHARFIKPMLWVGVALLASACNDTVEVGGNKDVANNDVNNDLPNNAVNNDVNNDPNNDLPNNDTPPECTVDFDCDLGQMCQGGSCVEGCANSDNCLEGTICSEGRCVGCRDDADCIDGTICEADQCVDGCRDDDGCTDGTVCNDGSCVEGCRDDAGCGDGTICTDGSCVAGCRDDGGCDDGTICTDESCVEGCRDDNGCGDGTICVDALCTEGCRDDGGCGDGTICVDDACVAGCRDDDGCDDEALCLGERCVLRGVGCREDADCNQGDRCDTDTQGCVPAAPECVADAREPNDTREDASALGAGNLTGMTLCPGDVDFFSIDLAAGEALEVLVTFNPEAGALQALLDGQEATNDGGLRMSLVANQAGAAILEVSAVNPEGRQSYALSVTITEPQVCVDTTIFTDTDGDGFGDSNASQVQCLEDGQLPEGFALQGGDCGVNDPLRNPDSQGVCRDFVDDDCDGQDEACPESQPSVVVPEWDCTGDAPSSVFAWARFDNGEGFFNDGGCFYFFEGLPGEFYVKRNIDRANTDPSCTRSSGCTCPSLNGWPAYDRRMYAFTTRPDLGDDCAQIRLVDHGGEQQPVSNNCRKYLYQMHLYDIPYSYIATGQEALRQRLEIFSTVEIACVEDAPHRNLPFQLLLTTQIEYNNGFAPMP